MAVDIDMNAEGYSGAQGRNYIPFGDGVERFKLLYVVQKTNLRNSKNMIIYGLQCTETDRPDKVKVGRKYSTSTNLDVKGQYNEKGTPAFYAAQEVSQFTASTMRMTHAEAIEAGINLTAVFNEYLARGEDLANDGIEIEIRSSERVIEDEDGNPVMGKDGKPKKYTNRYYNPIQD